MRLLTVVYALTMCAVPSLAAQARPGQNRAALQRQIVERIIANYANQAALSDEQLERVRGLIARSFADRRRLEMQQRQLILDLERQLRPGVAANPDSLAVLIGALNARKQEVVDLEKRDLEEFGSFLDPVQHAQLVLMLQRFQRQVEAQFRRRMQGNRPGRSPD